ncbi:MAG: hypothetical protein M0Z43_05770 [Acidithiobacillus sp.]|nr:hypothetical protein [Acidithiobacillus sp.]
MEIIIEEQPFFMDYVSGRSIHKRIANITMHISQSEKDEAKKEGEGFAPAMALHCRSALLNFGRPKEKAYLTTSEFDDDYNKIWYNVRFYGFILTGRNIDMVKHYCSRFGQVKLSTHFVYFRYDPL